MRGQEVFSCDCYQHFTSPNMNRRQFIKNQVAGTVILAASGLVHVAAAATMLHHRVSIGDVPLIASNPELGSGLPEGAGPRTVSVETTAMDGIAPRTGSVLTRSPKSKPWPKRHYRPARSRMKSVRFDALWADR